MKSYDKSVYQYVYVSDDILYSKYAPLADTLASNRLGKSFTPLAMDFSSKAFQICCSASFNSGTVLGIVKCLWLLQAERCGLI